MTREKENFEPTGYKNELNYLERERTRNWTCQTHLIILVYHQDDHKRKHQQRLIIVRLWFGLILLKTEPNLISLAYQFPYHFSGIQPIPLSISTYVQKINSKFNTITKLPLEVQNHVLPFGFGPKLGSIKKRVGLSAPFQNSFKTPFFGYNYI